MNNIMQEDKKILLQDLCARLPYGVKITDGLNVIKADPFISIGVFVYDGKWKPYLRPMSSMTEEEYETLKSLSTIYIPTDSRNIGFEDYGILVFTHHLTNNTYSFKLNIKVIDWLLENHFDYRGLIEKGLAIKVTEENNPYKL
jgi:hypothetical protein